MGERERKPFQLTFNGLLKVDFQGSRVTSDGGLILVRAQTLPRPAGPYFEPLPDWQYKAGIAPRGIVIAPGDSIIPQIANSGTQERL